LAIEIPSDLGSIEQHQPPHREPSAKMNMSRNIRVRSIKGNPASDRARLRRVLKLATVAFQVPTDPSTEQPDTSFGNEPLSKVNGSSHAYSFGVQSRPAPDSPRLCWVLEPAAIAA
jgi:hypothetical protein